MVRTTKALVALGVALGVALAVFGLLLPDTGSVAAQEATPSATRSLSASSVAPGEQFTVTIDIDYAGLGGFDKLAVGVEETLPTGFTFVTSTAAIAEEGSGGLVVFGPVGDSSFTYTVTASDAPGAAYEFSGVLVESTDDGDIRHSIGVSTIAVVATEDDTPTPTPSPTPETVTSGPSAERSLSAASVAAGGELVVTISIDYADLESFDRLAVGVEETLPAGFTYRNQHCGNC